MMKDKLLNFIGTCLVELQEYRVTSQIPRPASPPPAHASSSRSGAAAATSSGIVKTTALRSLERIYSEFFTELYEFMLMPSTSARVLDDCLLCVLQIGICLKWLNRIEMKEDRSPRCILHMPRAHFMDRLKYCSLVMRKSIAEDVRTTVQLDDNFVTNMDRILELLTSRNRAQFPPTTIRKHVESLLGHALTFESLLMPEDRLPYKSQCKILLRDCLNYQNNFETAPSIYGDELVNTLRKLDRATNACLVRMWFAVETMCNRSPLQNIAKLIIDRIDEDGQLAVDASIAAFDELNDRLGQIGTFAAAFTSKQADRTRIRSCLASLQCLESLLVPTMLRMAAGTQPDRNVEILMEHWCSESRRLLFCIGLNIDTRAVCANLGYVLHMFTTSKAEPTMEAFGKCTSDADVLLRHINCNYDELIANVSRAVPPLVHSNRNGCVQALRRLTSCCEAAMRQGRPDAADGWARVRKMANKLRLKVNEFAELLPNATSAFEWRKSLTERRDSRTDIQDEIFKEASIRVKNVSVLYTTEHTGHWRANRRQPSYSANTVEGEESLHVMVIEKPVALVGRHLLRPDVARDTSLRTTIFKRLPPSADSIEKQNETFDIDITEILAGLEQFEYDSE